MKQLNKDQLEPLLKDARVKPRLIRDLKFQPDNIEWSDRELVAIYAKNDNEGILILSPGEGVQILPFTISRRITDKQTGRSKAVICDFCFTYQAGSNAGRVTFPDLDGLRSTGYLCCADLQCSANVRTLTPASLRSRTQLHEDLTTEQRIERLKHKLQAIIERHGR